MGCVVCGGVLLGRQRLYCSAECAALRPQRLCKKCNRMRSVRSFSRDASRKDGYYPWCRGCRSVNVSSGSRLGDNSKLCLTCQVGIGGTHPNVRYCSVKCKSRASLARSYGLTVGEYQDVIASMNGKCPLCLKRVRKWNMDHNHSTGETYGPVCSPCNTKLIAWSFHDPELAKRLVDFLENPPVRKLFGPRHVTTKIQNQRENATKYRDAGKFPHGTKRKGKVVKRRRRK